MYAIAINGSPRKGGNTEMADALREARATPSGRVTSFRNRVRLDGALVTDETRTLPPSRERAPILRIAAGLAGVTALAAHLLDAGGVAGPPVDWRGAAPGRRIRSDPP